MSKIGSFPRVHNGEHFGFLKFIKAKKSYKMEGYVVEIHLSQSKHLNMHRPICSAILE